MVEGLIFMSFFAISSVTPNTFHWEINLICALIKGGEDFSAFEVEKYPDDPENIDDFLCVDTFPFSVDGSLFLLWLDDYGTAVCVYRHLLYRFGSQDSDGVFLVVTDQQDELIENERVSVF